VTRALVALLLTLAQLSVDAAPRRRAVRHPVPVTAPAAVVTAARQTAEAALKAGVPAVQIAVSERGQIIYSEAFGVTDKQSATAATPRSLLQAGSVTYPEFIQTEFALPLGLLDTGMCGTSHLPLPEGYGLVNGTWIRLPSLHPTVVWSSGSLCSTASDLARWAHLLATGHVMLPESYATMTTPHDSQTTPSCRTVTRSACTGSHCRAIRSSGTTV
jgi:CubicO group peptidase (beta-lactamase class C family)